MSLINVLSRVAAINGKKWESKNPQHFMPRVPKYNKGKKRCFSGEIVLNLDIL